MCGLLAAALGLVVLAATAGSSRADELDDIYREAIAHYEEGAYAEALPLFERALDLARARYGLDAPELAADYNNLGEVYRQLGQLDEAEEMFQKALAVGGPSSSGLAPRATSLNNLALVKRARGDLDAAANLHEEALALLETALGPNHPDVGRSLSNLAVVYLEQGRPDRALPLGERALRIAEAELGKSHPTTETIAQNLAAMERAVEQASREATAAAVEADAEAAPAPQPPRSAPRPPSATSGDYRIHVASVRREADVGPEYARLARRYPIIGRYPMQPTQKIEISGKGAFWRVLAGSFAAREEAAEVCRRIHELGGECRVVGR